MGGVERGQLVNREQLMAESSCRRGKKGGCMWVVMEVDIYADLRQSRSFVIIPPSPSSSSVPCMHRAWLELHPPAAPPYVHQWHASHDPSAESNCGEIMDWSPTSSAGMVFPQHPKLEKSSSSKRSVVWSRRASQKTVIRVKTEGNAEQHKVNRPPSDSWSWRKYGQKPIKGSPYPRGYYKCSTCKGCSAKKQVERCKMDASVLIVTYTSTHNHANPPLPAKRQKPPSSAARGLSSAPTASMNREASPEGQVSGEEEEEVGSFVPRLSPTPPPADANDFFDELEELVPISTSLLSPESTYPGFTGGPFFDERMLLPS